MISWKLKNAFILTLPKGIPTRPEGENIVRYFDPLPSTYFHRPQSFVCISYLLDKIYHYIKIISMISWIVKMLLFWHYQNISELDPGVKISYNILTPPLDILTPLKNRWQSFVCILYLVDNIYHYFKIILMISWIVIMILFWNYQKLS